jgi:hypothetical protein
MMRCYLYFSRTLFSNVKAACKVAYSSLNHRGDASYRSRDCCSHHGVHWLWGPLKFFSSRCWQETVFIKQNWPGYEANLSSPFSYICEVFISNMRLSREVLCKSHDKCFCNWITFSYYLIFLFISPCHDPETQQYTFVLKYRCGTR